MSRGPLGASRGRLERLLVNLEGSQGASWGALRAPGGGLGLSRRLGTLLRQLVLAGLIIIGQ